MSAGGDAAQAKRRFTEAVETFTAAGAGFEAGRTRPELAALAGEGAAADQLRRT